MTETTEGRERSLPASFGPKPAHLRRAEIVRQIRALGSRLEGRWLALGLPGGAVAMAESLANQMVVTGNAAGRRSAAELIARSLLDVGERDDPAFWATDLGRAIAREIGWPGILPARVIARNVLHVSRQAVDQMVARGDLDAGSGQAGPCVTRQSLQRAAARRWPHENDI